MIYLRADGHKATITKDLPITTGSVGLQVEVSLSEDFDGLASVVTFRAGTVVADVAYVGELVEVPPQVMTKPNTALLIGVYAQSADGRTVIPTVWDNAGIIQPGTLPEDFPQPDPAPSWAAQVQLWAQEAHETAEALAEDVSEWGVAEDGRVAAEQSRVTAESARVQAESRRASAETARVNAETARAQAETEREDAESIRSSLEALRVQAESEREGAESARVEAESSRTTAESARASAETARASAESSRATAESQRAAAETARVSAEQVRAIAEEGRVLAEEGRVAAESARVEAESERESEWAALRTDVTSATSSANAAATAASEAESDLRAAAARGDFDGYSPTVAIASTDTEHTVTVTDRQGDHSYTVPTYSVEEQAREDAWSQLSQDAQDAIDAATAAAESVSDDVDALYNGIDMLRHDIRTAEVEGGIAVTENAAKAVPVDLTVYGVSEQDGTPTPDAPVDIVSAENPVLWLAASTPTFLNDSDDWLQGSIRTSDGATIPSSNRIRSSVVPVVAGETYAIHVNDGFECSLRGYSAEPVGTDTYVAADVTDFAQEHTWTPTQSTCLRLVLRRTDDSRITPDNANELYVFVVAALASATLPVTLRSTPDGTKDQLDLTYDRPSNRKGWAWYKADVTRAVGDVDMGELTWTRYTNKTNPYFRATLPNSHIYNSNDGMPANKTRIEIGYTWASGTGTLNYASLDQRYNVGSWELGSNSHYLSVVDKQYETAEAFKAAMTGMEFMYELQTPITETLPDMELPVLPLKETTVYCTSGSLQPEWHMTYQIDADAELVEVQERVDILEYKTDHMWGNRLTGSMSGTVLTTGDAYTAPLLEVEVDGKSEQFTTTGKNLFDASTAEVGYINSSGGQSGSSDWLRSGYIPVVAGTTYTFTPNSTSGGSAYGCWYDADQGVLSTFPSGPTTQTAPSGAAYVRVSYRATSTNVQLEIGSTATTYEPYTGGKPSPSPDYPQEIVSVVDPVLTVAGRNLFDIDSAWIASSYGGQWRVPTYGAPGNTVTKVDNGVTVDPHSGNFGLYVSLGHFLAGTYTVSLTKPTSAPATLYSYPTEPDYGTHPGLESLGVIASASAATGAMTFTLEDDTWLLIGSYVNSSAVLGLYDIQIEAGSTATTCQPYSASNVTLPVTLRSLPNGTKDSATYTYLRPSTREGWAWYSGKVTRVVGEVDLGTLSWEPASKDGKWVTNVPNMAGNVNVTKRMCSHYTVVASQSTGDLKPDKTIGPRSVATSTALYLRDDDYPPSTTAPSVLEEALIGVQYTFIVATPTTETIDPIELPVLHAPNVTICATADATPTLVVEYEKDVTIAYNALLAAIADLATS